MSFDNNENCTGIHYITGDATQPIGKGNKIICHICNDVGIWGAGFVLALSNRWSKPETEYKNWYLTAAVNGRLPLGEIQMVAVDPGICVANMIGQYGVDSDSLEPPIRYEAVKTALFQLVSSAKKIRASVHMPKIGCGLAGGEWSEVEKIIQETLVANGIPVYVYNLPETNKSIKQRKELNMSKEIYETKIRNLMVFLMDSLALMLEPRRLQWYPLAGCGDDFFRKIRIISGGNITSTEMVYELTLYSSSNKDLKHTLTSIKFVPIIKDSENDFCLAIVEKSSLKGTMLFTVPLTAKENHDILVSIHEYVKKLVNKEPIKTLMKIETLLQSISSDEQVICIQDKKENVLFLNTKSVLLSDYSQFLKKEIEDMYSERYPSLSGISGITITI